MLNIIHFSEKAWNPEEFRYVYSPLFTPIPRMKQESLCIVNDGDATSNKYDYVSMVTEKKYAVGTRVEMKCSFEKFGAPLIVFSDDMYRGGNGEWYYGRHYEIVLYEDGINVWGLNMNPGIKKYENLMSLRFPVSAGEIHVLSVKIQKSALEIVKDDLKVILRVPDLPSEFHVGLTACEGINRFYEYTIEEV